MKTSFFLLVISSVFLILPVSVDAFVSPPTHLLPPQQDNAGSVHFPEPPPEPSEPPPLGPRGGSSDPYYYEPSRGGSINDDEYPPPEPSESPPLGPRWGGSPEPLYPQPIPRPVPQISCSKAKANLALLKMDKKKALDEYHRQKANSLETLGSLCNSYKKMNGLAYDVASAKDDQDSACKNYDSTKGVLGATPPLLTCDPLCKAFNSQRRRGAESSWSPPVMSCEETKNYVKDKESQKATAAADYYKKKQSSGSVVENMCKQYQIVDQLSYQLAHAVYTKDVACDNDLMIGYNMPIVMDDPFCQAVTRPSFTNIPEGPLGYRHREDRGISSATGTGGSTQ